MKVIFLDIDGVLITQGDIAEAKRLRLQRPWPSTYRIEQLNRIIAATDARIVVTSSWRIGRTCKDMEDILGGWGVKWHTLGVPWYAGFTRNFGPRWKEINWWL